MKKLSFFFAVNILSIAYAMEQTWNAKSYDENSESQYQTAIGYLKKNIGDLKRFKTIASIGCGTGRVEEFMAKQAPNSLISGYDASEDMITYAQKKYSGQKNLFFTVMRAQDFKSFTVFNLIFSSAVVHWIPWEDQQDVLNRTAKHLSKDGELHILMSSDDSKHPLRTTIEKIVAQSSTWQTLLPNFLNTPMHYPQTKENMKKMLCKANLNPITVESILREKKFASKEKFADWLKAFAGGITVFAHLTDAQRNQLLDEVIEDYAKEHGQDDGSIIHKLPLLIVHAKKD